MASRFKSAPSAGTLASWSLRGVAPESGRHLCRLRPRLNTAIKKFESQGRKADNPRFVQTLPRRGYRFIGPVDKPSSQAVPPVASKGWFQRFPARRKWLIASTTLLILLSGIGIWRFARNRADALPPLAVAPLAVPQRRLTANPDDIPLMGRIPMENIWHTRRRRLLICDKWTARNVW